ncbi:MAG: hypothetical protein JRH15_22430, partial [Deltaproteobacteria bacterium]|nr:hypothetical protein [Deltaproteobacteria bacterium]
MYTLGIELSTQSVKTVVLDLTTTDIIHCNAISYDEQFPRYGTRGGVVPSESPDIRHTSPLMLIEALDVAFDNLAQAGIDLSKLQAIKADGMQHCTVYTHDRFVKTVNSLDPKRPLAGQLGDCFSRKTAPIWEDRSTDQEAAYLTKAMKQTGGIEKLTGNRAELRFPAAQILKWASQNPQAYDQTSHIWILS